MAPGRRGFTLVEIMVVITIIGILASLGFTNYIASQKRARDGRRKADLEQIRSALEIYRSDCKTYPATAAMTSAITSGGQMTGVGTGCAGNIYMDKVPNDPLPGHTYIYSGSANSYTLCSYLETSSSPQGCGNCIIGTNNSCYYKVTNY